MAQSPRHDEGTDVPEQNLKTARQFLLLWAASNEPAYGQLLAENVTFKSPRVSLDGSAALSAIAEFSKLVSAVDEIAAVGSDNVALVHYDMHTIPFGVIRACDHYTFASGRIQSVETVFDTASLTSD